MHAIPRARAASRGSTTPTRRASWSTSEVPLV
jgi:hypothetical protein